jgi:predicted MFS family arabinose efflux permease
MTAPPAPIAPPRRHGFTTVLVAMTGAKSTSNLALRWIGPFLPTLERAFGASTGTLTGVIGAAELSGLSTSLIGRVLDRGRHRVVIAGGLLLASASSVVALGGSVWTFALAMVLLVVGVANLTVAGLAYIGDRVPFERRGRAIGIFETSWAIALLAGAPVIALVIEAGGWRAAYLTLAVLTTVGAFVVWRMVPGVPAPTVPGRPDHGEPAPTGRRLPASAWAPIMTSALLAAAGLGMFVVTGVWLEDRHGLAVGGLGLVATAMGAVELVSSSSVAAFADRIGLRRSVAGGTVLLGCGIAVIAVSGDSTLLAVIGLLILVAGFEFGFVASLSVMSEAAPGARGTALAVGNAVGTLSRSAAVVLSGQLYDAFGVSGSLGLAAVALTGAGAAIGVQALRRP